VKQRGNASLPQSGMDAPDRRPCSKCYSTQEGNKQQTSNDCCSSSYLDVYLWVCMRAGFPGSIHKNESVPVMVV